MNDIRYVTVAELAERWRVSKQFVYERVWSGEIAATYFGRSVRITEEAAEAYEDAAAEQPAAVAA
jgi:excisionase family DNA binding protein